MLREVLSRPDCSVPSSGRAGLAYTSPSISSNLVCVWSGVLDRRPRCRPMHHFASPCFPSRTSPRAACADFRDHSIIRFKRHSSVHIYNNFVLSSFLRSSGTAPGTYLSSQAWEGLVYHYCHHYSDEATTAFALTRAERDLATGVWPIQREFAS